MALQPLVSLSFKPVMVLAWFPITSSWNTACYIQGLILGIGRGVPNATNKWSRGSADAITSQVGGQYRHVGGIFSLEWTSRCLVLGVQNRILEVWQTPLILNFGVWRQFQDVIYAIRRLNKSPESITDLTCKRWLFPAIMKFQLSLKCITAS